MCVVQTVPAWEGSDAMYATSRRPAGLQMMAVAVVASDVITVPTRPQSSI